MSAVLSTGGGKSSTAFVPFIHLLRGFAPILVVWAHLAGWWFSANGDAHFPRIWTLYQAVIVGPLRLTQDGGHFGVVLFFCISGYIMSHVAGHETRAEFVVKRVFRLMPTLIIAVAIMGILTESGRRLGFPKMIGNDGTCLRDYLVSAFLLDYVIDMKPLSLSVTWSLGAEVIFYAIIAAVIPLLRTRPIIVTWVMTALAVLFVLPWKYSAVFGYGAYFSIYLPLFIIGRAFYLDQTKQADGRSVLSIVVVNAVLFCLLYSFRWPGKLLQSPTEPIVTYAGAVLLFYVVMHANVRSVPPVVRFLADISYSLYLVHLPIGGFTMSAVAALGASRSVVLISGISAAVVAAATITRYVEKPVQACGHRVIAWLKPETPRLA
jgi:peptidoglycan/LPS O-acetylase OafA/YrhL